MRLLLDTHLVLWSLFDLPKLPPAARSLMEDTRNEICFSVVNIWEIAVKRQLGRRDFLVDPRMARRTMLESGYMELIVNGSHAESMDTLPLLHRDPFDRMLIQQAVFENATLITSDKAVAEYAGPIRLV
jgi:PIN domain nuclease of toxin-antitoxin system